MKRAQINTQKLKNLRSSNLNRLAWLQLTSKAENWVLDYSNQGSKMYYSEGLISHLNSLWVFWISLDQFIRKRERRLRLEWTSWYAESWKTPKITFSRSSAEESSINIFRFFYKKKLHGASVVKRLSFRIHINTTFLLYLRRVKLFFLHIDSQIAFLLAFPLKAFQMLFVRWFRQNASSAL